MKNIKIIITILLFLSGLNLFSQQVIEVKHKSEANLVIYVTNKKSEATLIVYKTEYKSDSNKNPGVWYYTKYKSDAYYKIYNSIRKSEANEIVFFTNYKSEAGYKKK